MKYKMISLFVGVVLLSVLSGCAKGTNVVDEDFNGVVKVDDWEYIASQGSDSNIQYSTGSSYSSLPTTAAPMMMEEAIGFSVGGAKDVGNFRENIDNDFLPLPTDLSYEGLFYDYYFDTGQSEECEELFCPSYTYAVSKDPFSKQDDYYLSVGLNSGIKESDFERKKLNLVVVLDISGSMGSPFDEYYYDSFKDGFLEEDYNEDGGKSKMDLANESVVALMDHLNPSDRFGMVVFDDAAYLGKPLSYIGKTDVEKIKKHILDLKPMNGTYMESGMQMGTDLFNEYKGQNSDEYENRIIFLTDAMPNIGELSEEGLFGMLEDNADDRIYTSFIGIGVDFNSELVSAITKVEGANYYSVHSGSDFKKRMDEEFEYMVTPLVFDLVLDVKADGYDIEKVYGSPEADEATGEIMHVNTLFPSKNEGGETRGGLVLLKLKKTSDDGTLDLLVSYKDRNGKSYSNTSLVEFGDEASDFYENNGIRKGVLLSRYADMMIDWLIDERRMFLGEDEDVKKVMPYVTYEDGILVPPVFELGEWERQSEKLFVSKHYKDLFKEFKAYFESEMKAIGDETLEQELKILDKLLE